MGVFFMLKKIELTQEDMEQIMLREVEFFKVMDDVSVIIIEGKKEGDDALKKFTKEFDGADIVNIEHHQAGSCTGMCMPNPSCCSSSNAGFPVRSN
jgi:histidinol dehydrogenase